MSFLGMFPTVRERKLASEEAAYALEKYGHKAALTLLQKAQQTRSRERRTIYKLAAQAVKMMRAE